MHWTFTSLCCINSPNLYTKRANSNHPPMHMQPHHSGWRPLLPLSKFHAWSQDPTMAGPLVAPPTIRHPQLFLRSRSKTSQPVTHSNQVYCLWDSQLPRQPSVCLVIRCIVFIGIVDINKPVLITFTAFLPLPWHWSTTWVLGCNSNSKSVLIALHMNQTTQYVLSHHVENIYTVLLNFCGTKLKGTSVHSA